MRRTTRLLSILTLILIISSCHKSLDPGATVAVKAANGWWVTFTQGGADVFGLKTFFISTYNTAGNNDSLWVDDLGHSWGFKSKTPANFSTLTFSGSNLTNEYAPDSVSITNGKVLLKAGRARSGTITDSIYFQVSFSDDPSGQPYVVSGTARTGIIADDYQ